MNSLLQSVCRRFAAGVARRSVKDFLVIFTYHQVTPEFEVGRHNRDTWTPLTFFERQLELIASSFRLASLPAAVSALKRGELRGPTAAITLDDGDISLETHVVPLLEKLGVPATFFVNSAYWDECHLHWAALMSSRKGDSDESEADRNIFAELRKTRNPKRYGELREMIEGCSGTGTAADDLLVSKRFLRELDPELFSVGLHGHEHQRFSMMPATWQRKCIERNIECLSDLPGYCRLFAVPFGRPHDWDDTVAGICDELELELVLGNGGINRLAMAVWQRIPVDNAPALGMFRHSLVGW